MPVPSAPPPQPRAAVCGFCANCRNSLYSFPKVVCFIGSMRHADTFYAQNTAETLGGNITLLPGVDTKKFTVSEGEKARLDELHLFKIDMADEVLVINPDGYIGESTRREIEYARRRGKVLRWLTPPQE